MMSWGRRKPVRFLPGNKLISQSLQHLLEENSKNNPLAVLTGPTIAPEAADGVMTTALIASEDVTVAKKLAATLSTPSFILHATNDTKNIRFCYSENK